MPRIFRIHAVVLLGLLLVTGGCMLDSREAGRGSFVENEVAGILYNAEGEAVAGATVKVLPVGYVPKGGLVKVGTDTLAVFSTTTDKEGRYVLDSLPAGEYNILGEADGTYSYLDSVTYNAELDSLPSDTLRAPGSLTARVLLEPGDDARSVFVQVLGTNTFCNTDSLGYFTLRGLAGGEYSLRLVTILDAYTPTFLSARVRSGIADTLREPIRPIYTGIPVVRSLSASYDTARGVVRLSWPAVSYAFLRDYAVYRFPKGALNPPSQPIGRSADTVYLDTLGGYALATPLPGQPEPTFEYRVRVRNRGDSVGEAFADAQVVAAPRRLVETLLELRDLSHRAFKAGLADTLALAVDWENPSRETDSLEVALDALAPMRRAVAGLKGSDTVMLPLPAAAGFHTLSVRAWDSRGDVWVRSVTVQVLLDAPIADAGPDTTVSIGDLVRLRGRGTDAYGSIVAKAWDIGNRGVFVPVPGGDTQVVAGTRPGKERHVFRVTDEDGNEDLDTLDVRVLLDAPVADAGPDTTVTIGDLVRLRGRGTDAYGSIVAREWDIGNRGVFAPVSGGDTQVVASNQAGYQFHVLRLTDDDGNQSLDTLRVTVRNDHPSVNLGWEYNLVDRGGGYRAQGQATDLGRIVRWEWDFGDGQFRLGNGPDTVIHPTVPPGTPVTIRLKAVDEDGNESFASTQLKHTAWEFFAELPWSLRDASSLKLAELDGKFYVLLESGLKREDNANLYSFDPVTKEWVRLPKHPDLLAGSAFIGGDGRLFTFGGNRYGRENLEVWEFDPVFGEWAKAPDMPWNCNYCKAAKTDTSLLLVPQRPDVMELELRRNVWGNPGNVFHPGSSYVKSIAFAGGRLYAHLDWDVFGYWLAAENRWIRILAPPPEYGQLVVAAGKVHHLATDNTGNLARFDPATISWSMKSNALWPHRENASIEFEGRIYSIGKDGVQRYDPLSEP